MKRREILEKIIEQAGHYNGISNEDIYSIGFEKIEHAEDALTEAMTGLDELNKQEPKPKYTAQEIEFMDKCAISVVAGELSRIKFIYDYAKQLLEERRRVLNGV